MKKSLIKILSVILSVFLILSLSSCSEDKQAKERLTQMLDTLKAGDYVKAVTDYTLKTENGSYDFLSSGGNFDQNAFPAYDMHLAVFESLEYKIKSTEIIDETQIRFSTTITTTDLTPVGMELAKATAAYNITAENAEADEKLSDSELNDLLTQQMVNISNEYLEGNDVKTRTSTVEIVMCYDVANGWVVYIDESLADALCGGVYTAFYQEMTNADMVTK